MIISTVCTLAAVLSSLVAVNGAVIQREGPILGLLWIGNTTTTPTNTSSVSPNPSTAPTMLTTSPTTPIPSKTTTTPNATSIATPVAANCSGLQQWRAAFAYSAGDRVIFNGQLYMAKQWTYNNAPLTHPDQWTPGGTCAQPINNMANCSGIATWQSAVAYTAGNETIYNNHLWSAVRWTESNSPGDASGSWKDVGACA